MNKNTIFSVAAIAATLCLTATTTLAQPSPGQRDQGRKDQGRPDQARPDGKSDRGRFDPAQMRERMNERYKEVLEITDDTEWNAIQPLIDKVTTARMASFGGMGRMFGRRPGGDRGETRTAAAIRTARASSAKPALKPPRCSEPLTPKLRMPN